MASNNQDNDDVNDPKPGDIGQVFEKVVERISSSSSSSSSISTDTKLRLYGLYKYCTVGPCPGNASLWSPTELTKQRAWQQACEEGMDTSQAQLEYVRLAASLDDSCQALLNGYYNDKSKEEKEKPQVNEHLGEKDSKHQSTETIIMDDKTMTTQTRQSNSVICDTNETVEKPTNGVFSFLFELWNLFCSAMAGCINIQPVIPRGGLDIAWSDLWFALRACITTTCWYSVARRRQLEEETQKSIEALWKEQASSPLKQDSNTQVVVGYSVRSLLDLYLMHKKFPPQASKEVIVVPPINIPGMVQVLEHYGLVVVPVDIMPDSSETTTMINLEAVQAAMTERTVAILVVHPFGNASLSLEGFAKLRAMVNEKQRQQQQQQQQHTIEIWEDAAESYCGVSESTGSPHADVTFLSFGLIKTATALGGGVAILRNNHRASDSDTGESSNKAASAMRRLQNHQFVVQTTWQFAWRKVAQAMLIQTFSSNPTLYGCFVYLCLQWGGYDFLDRMVTQNLRSIVASTSSTSKSNNEWMRSIRIRPSLPLLQLLSRRLAQSTQTSLAVRRRIQQCEEMTRLLQTHAPGIGQFPSADNPDLVMTHWLYPIQVDPEKKRHIQKYVLQRGWDVTAGTSQLQCVQPTCKERYEAPQKMQDIMDKVLYLPVASRSLSKQQSKELAMHLQQAIANDAKDTNAVFSQSNIVSKAKAVLLVLFILLLSSGGYQTLQFAFGFIFPKVLLLFVYGFISMVCLAYLVQWLGGSLYLELFSGFGRYSSMVEQMCLDHDETDINDSSPKQSPPSPSTDSNIGVISSMRSLDIPASASSRRLPNDCSGCAILTGATGFVGSLILRDLLFHRKALNLTAGVFVVCRKKRSKNAPERVAELLDDGMFSFLSESERHDLVHVLDGDVTQTNAGLSDQDMNHLLLLAKQRKVITHIIHSAACVSFTQELDVAARSNITSALNVQNLTVRLGETLDTIKDVPPPKFVYLSTAFVHGSMSGTIEDPLAERLFPLDPYDPQKLYASMLGTQFYASKAMNDLRFHNTYAFTKCVCEHLLVQRNRGSASTLIIRPSIVGPALENPTEGWAGQKPSTIVAAGCLYLSYQWNLWSFGNYDVPCIPVDILSRFVLQKSFDEETFKQMKGRGPTDTTSSEDSFERVSSCSSLQSRSSSDSQGESDSASECQMARIYNAAWSSTSASCAMFTWLDYCGATLQLGSIMGYLNRSTACFTLWITSRLLPRFGLRFENYEILHYYLVQAPVKTVVSLCHSFGWKGLEYKLSKLSGFLDLPLLFFPYMNDTFHFKSSLSAPETMNGSRYVFSCIVAAHCFLKKINPGLNQGKNRRSQHGKTGQEQMDSFVIGGKQHILPVNLWWALTQPKGCLATRLAGWVFAMILKATCHVLSIDVASFESTMQKMHSESENSSEEVYLILAPTHRSFFDFIILSYVTFVLPELGIDVPKIAAAEDFEDLPVVGYLAQILGAFYIRRGRGRADPELRTKLVEMKKNGTRVFEVFLEGTRSRDRRFLEPRTGVLRSLADSGGVHLIVPVAISYEKLPEQDILTAETVGQCDRRALNTGGLISWMMSVLRGKVNLGRIHVAAGPPSVLDCKSSSEFKQLAKTIQLEQQRRLHNSDYHIRATAKVLSMDPQLVRSALVGLGCHFTPPYERDSTRALALPENSSEACTVMLHFSHELAKVCHSQLGWQRWFDHNCDDEHDNDGLGKAPDIALFSQSLLSLLAAADDKVEKAYEALVASGFHDLNLKHLQQTAQKMCSDGDVPLIMVNAAAAIFHAKLKRLEHAENIDDDTISAELVHSNTSPQLLMESEERLGFWGFRDSGFFLQVGKKGSYGVSMRGRYAVSGRSLSKLLPFVEAETGVPIDPFNEAFKITRPASNRTTLIEDVFSEDDVGLLQSTVWKVTLSLPDRIRHGTGHSQEDIYAIRDCSNLRIPDAVVWPTSEEEIGALLSAAKKKCWCLIPFGGGTNVTQSTRCPSREVEPRPILSVDVSKMNRLLWLNEEDGLACFQAGINGRDMVEALERRGFTMGHEPDSIEFSTLGGWIATKASGMKRNKYGNIEDIVRRVRVASSSGMTWQGGEEPNDAKQPVFGRESCGLDFQSIILGSEGCLGIITSAVVRVWLLPEVKAYESILFTSFSSGLGFVRDVAKLDRMIPASVRLLDNEHFRLGQALRGEPSSMKDRVLNTIRTILIAGTAGNLDPRTVACATVCYEGNKKEVQLQKAEMERVAKDHGGFLLGPQIGKAGYDMTFLIAYLRDFAMTYHFLGESFETFAPWSRVASIIDRTKQRVKSEHENRCLPGRPFVGCRVTQLYHEGACLYFYVCINTENVKNPSRVFSEIEQAARSEILQQGGSLSHHHGVGKLRASFLRETATPAFKRLVRSVKESMDPDNIFAAGNGLFGE